MTGIVKWFNDSKGFGFLTSEDNKDVFVQYTEIKGEGYKTLPEGAKVTFDVVETDRGLHASNVEVTRGEG